VDLSRRQLLAALAALPGCRSFRNLRPHDAEVTRSSGLAYLEDGHARHRLDLFAPQRPGPHPVVVFVHGGFWRAQDRNSLPLLTGLYANVGASLAARGFLTYVISYRLHPEVTGRGMVEDVVAAIRFARRTAAAHRGDPEQLYLAGHSAGAHLVALIGGDPSLGGGPIAGVVALSGLYDLRALRDRAAPDVRDGVLGPAFGLDDAALERWSPQSYFPTSSVPYLFVVGEHDLEVCRRDYFAAQAHYRGRPSLGHFRLLPGRSHAEVALEIGGPTDSVSPAIAAMIRSGQRRGKHLEKVDDR
jgi:acetyl esterase/lipase